MLNLKKFNFAKKLIILATALLFAWVGISCGSDRPTEAADGDLRRPDDVTNVIGGSDGMLPANDPRLEDFKNEMINIRLISDSSDGVAYYRAPVIVVYDGVNKKTGMGIFYEKRFGQGGDGDVGVDGNAKVDIVFMANGKGGDNLYYASDNKVGSDPSAEEGKEYSKGSPVVFVNGKEIAVVAASGAGTKGGTSRGESEVKIVRGTASGDTINFGSWEDLDISYTSGSTVYSNSAAIIRYVKDKINGNFNAFYTRWGHGKVDSTGQKWILPLKLIQNANLTSTGSRGGLLVLYSEDGGKTWKFGPHMKFDGTPYNEGLGLSVSDDGTAKVALVPHNPNNPIGTASVTLEDCSQNAKGFTVGGTSSFQDSYNNFEMNKLDKDNAYFINTRERSGRTIDGFIVNKKLTIALLNDPADDLSENISMLMSRMGGSGSVAVLADGTIVTCAEEAFAEYRTSRENRYNIVQRRFTKGYIQARADDGSYRIIEDEEYYNPSFNESEY